MSTTTLVSNLLYEMNLYTWKGVFNVSDLNDDEVVNGCGENESDIGQSS